MFKYPLFFILCFASLRGVVIYYYGINPQMVYYISSALLICTGMFSFIKIYKYNGSDKLLKLKKYVFYNYVIIGFYFITTSILREKLQIGMIYQFGIFPVVFMLIRYDKKYLERILFIISVVTLYGVLNFYLIGLTPDGYYTLINIKETLRPNSESISKIGLSLQSFGFQGSHHDAANILTMSFAFYLSKALKSVNGRKFIYFALSIIVLLILFLTGSASNISISLVISSIYTIIWSRKHGSNFLLIILIIIISIFFFGKIESIIFFTKKFVDQGTLAQGGVFNSLNINSILYSFHSIIFGYGFVLGVPLVFSELALVKMIIGYGIIPFCMVLFIILSPFYYLSIFKKRINLNYSNIETSFKATRASIILSKKSMTDQLFYSTLPVLCGVATLLHYGSLFRITSIGLFCVLLVLFYKEYIEYTDFLDNEN
jgi:hypothetical protein